MLHILLLVLLVSYSSFVRGDVEITFNATVFSESNVDCNGYAQLAALNTYVGGPECFNYNISSYRLTCSPTRFQFVSYDDPHCTSPNTYPLGNVTCTTAAYGTCGVCYYDGTSSPALFHCSSFTNDVFVIDQHSASITLIFILIVTLLSLFFL